jgi:signal transduction histidine kinase
LSKKLEASVIRWILRSRQLALILISFSLALFSAGIELISQNLFGLIPSLFLAAIPAISIRSSLLAAITLLPAAISIAFFASQPLIQVLFLSLALLVLSLNSSRNSRIALLIVGILSLSVLMFQVGYVRNFLGPYLNPSLTVEMVRTQSMILVGGFALGLWSIAYLIARLSYMRVQHVGGPKDQAQNTLNESRLRLEISKQNERLEIAKDLSELLVQRINAIVSVTEGGRYAVKADSTVAERVFERSYEAAREAQKELRRLYDYMNSAIYSDVSMFKISDLQDVAVAMREFGYNTVISEHGDSFALNDGMELCAFKIVYESITNVRKHAPVGTEISIDFLWVEDGLQILIKDNGEEIQNRNRAALGELVDGYSAAEDLDALVSDFDGATLAALRDRAKIYGGRIEATKVPGVGFTISAIFPDLKRQVRAQD